MSIDPKSPLDDAPLDLDVRSTWKGWTDEELRLIGPTIMFFRDERGLSFRELGKELGTTGQSVANWEGGTYYPSKSKVRSWSTLGIAGDLRKLLLNLTEKE